MVKCPECDTENTSDSQFCKKCATPLPTEEISAPTETLEAAKDELTTGSTFAGRYQIIEELGKGGMGKVYRVIDKKLKEEVALKLIKPEIGSDKKTVERFSNELKLARKIVHKNVARMFDLNEEKGSHYITMEYVPGEDLKRLIRKVGQLSSGKTISIAIQVCEGLAEAHRLGVVHRDLKPNNVMIDEEGNARIMDFGIARSLEAKGITGAGMMIGTPEYMSPEQVEGKKVDQRSDIYSLGIILYEMVTGRVPFEGETPFSIAFKHKSETPRNPKEVNAQIPEDLSHVILRCLEKDKELRYQSAGEVRSELEKIEKGIPTTEKVVPKRKPITSKEITVKFTMKKVFIPAVAVLLALAAVFIFIFRRQGPQLDPNRIVVAVFENRTGNPELDHLGRMAHDWITQGLQQTGTVSVATWLPEQISEEDKREKDFVRRISSETDAGKVVTGNYYLQGDVFQFHASVHDSVKGKLLHAFKPVSGSAEDPMIILETLRQKIMGQLAMLLDERWESFLLSEFQIPTYEAYREYMAGYEFFSRFEYKRAIEHCYKAYALDPDFIFPLFLIVHSHINSGEPAKAEPLIEKLEQHRDKFSPVTRHLLDYTKAELNHNWIDAYRFARQAVQLDKEHSYNLAYYAICINRPDEAIDILQAIDPEKGIAKDWIPYWGELTYANHMLGNHREELKEARRGRKLYPESLETLSYEVRAQAALGRIKEVDRLVEESFNLVPEEDWNPGRVMFEAGAELRQHENKDESFQVLKRAIEWYKDRPHKDIETESYRYDLARVYYTAEMWGKAKSLFEDLHREFPENVNYEGCLGSTLARMGDKEHAIKISKQLEILDRSHLFGRHTFWRAQIAAVLGEKENAVRLLQESLTEGRSYYEIHYSMDFESLWDFPPFQELIKPKE